MCFPLSQVNGVLPILPLLFPVLWVLATACGEARVLAQMSKGSPSSLVGFSKASEGTFEQNKHRNKRGSWLCPSEQEQEPSPPGGPAHGQALGSLQGVALSIQKRLQAGHPGG